MKHLLIKHKLSECKMDGIENNWQLQTCPSLEHLNWDGLKLPQNLESFFRVNPTLRSFQTGTFIFNETIQLLLKSDIKLDELYLILANVMIRVDDIMAQYISNLNTLYERKQFKCLMIHFVSSYNTLKNPRWSQLKYLNGICCEVPENESTEAIESLNLKLLILGNKRTLLSSDKAESLSKKLVNLE